MIWSDIEYWHKKKTLQALAVVLQEERRLISQHTICHIAGQIKVQLFYPFRIKFMKIAAHAHINDLSIINLVLS